jgi:hypothetical protein
VGISDHVSAADAIRFLRTASDPEAQFYIAGQKPDLNYRGIVRFVKDGWVLQAYWKNGFLNYVDSLTAPWGSIGNSKQWHEDDGAPDRVEDLLTEDEFGWLCWSLMAADAVENPDQSERFTHSTLRDDRRDVARETRDIARETHHQFM